MAPRNTRKSSEQSIREACARFPGVETGVFDACAQLDERVGQLAISFPLAFFALATGWGPLINRKEAIRRAVAGQRLASIAAVLGLPLCLRRVRPEACSDTLPVCAFGDNVSLVMASLLPTNQEALPGWLQTVFKARQFGDDAFALWIAREVATQGPKYVVLNGLLPLALFAWHTHQPRNEAVPEVLARVFDRHWSPEIGLGNAVLGARIWLNRVKFLAFFSPSNPLVPWFEGGTVGPFRIEPLIEPLEIIAHARAMRNCLDTYAEALASDRCQVFAVWHEDARVATLEFRREWTGDQASIAQLLGPCNEPVCRKTKAAVLDWLARHNRQLPPQRRRVRSNVKLRRVFQSYLHATGAGEAGWLSELTWDALDGGLKEIAHQNRLYHWSLLIRR